ncbi:HPP family protein [Desulfacinum hydrothermale DSM 13146]|uniref:HPP family protein n=1 Tax=Desulfacinum hydrothermale DSM 13146 TaxID=1121390 RepID=A0A1W1WYN1_9BACT|nr:HPP family protein [Desulfacinum hydrothermale]SMC16727.1 HPP family protein [Desulfacinum hydrothermale DSM 13146]
MRARNFRVAPAGPQSGRLFRLVAFFARFQLRMVLRTTAHMGLVLGLFVGSAAVTSLVILTLGAYAVRLPFLFPPLGPSAFVLFHTPMSDRACPRNVLLSHSLSVLCGVGILRAVEWTGLGSVSASPEAFRTMWLASVVLSLGASVAVMLALDCVHPPAAASALIAAMGYVSNPAQIIGFICAVVLLTANAVFFNRVLGGLPYPLWRADPRLVRSYGVLAGIPSAGTGYWQELAATMITERRGS